MKHSEDKCDHDHQHSAPLAPDRIFKIGISLNLAFVFIEIYFGIIHNSLALVSDALHNLADVFGLVIAWLGFVLSKKAATKKFSIYATFINTCLLLMSSVWIIIEAVGRYHSMQTPVASTMMIVAFIGFIINFMSARMFHHGHHHDLNMKSAYLHLMADAAVSLGVVVAGVVIYYKAIFWIDPAMSALISIIIIFSTWSLFRESINMLRGKTPTSVNLDLVKESILKKSEIKAISEIRVWALSTSENAMSVKLELREALTEVQLKDLKHRMLHEFRISEILFSSNISK